MLFEVAIVEKPTPKEAEAGAMEALKYGPKPIVAKDMTTARYMAVIEAGTTVDLARAEVLVRPFA